MCGFLFREVCARTGFERVRTFWFLGFRILCVLVCEMVGEIKTESMGYEPWTLDG